MRGHVVDQRWVRGHYRIGHRALLAASAGLLTVAGLLGAGHLLGAARLAGPAGSTAAGQHTAVPPPVRAGALSLYVEPRAGYRPVAALIASARATLKMSMYELRDPALQRDLAAAAARGVRVQVVLDGGPERDRNQPAYSYLTAHRVPVAWSPPWFAADHEKAVTADDNAAAILTGNLVAADYPSTRDVLLIDHNRADVAAIAASIAADAAHSRASPPPGADLVWSPTSSQASILDLIEHARRQLFVEDEEMADPDITAALVAAARRGVAVTVVMTEDPRWRAAFARLRAAGVHVRAYRDGPGMLYIHAKILVADPDTTAGRALIGSQNFSIPSLRYNRELGLLTSQPRIVRAATDVVLRGAR